MDPALLFLLVSFLSSFPFPLLFTCLLFCAFISLISTFILSLQRRSLFPSLSFPSFFFPHKTSSTSSTSSTLPPRSSLTLINTAVLSSLIVLFFSSIPAFLAAHPSLDLIVSTPVVPFPFYGFKSARWFESCKTVEAVYPEGRVTGISVANVETFRGIPYAQPPVGDLRLRRPRRLAASVGHLEAIHHGPSCPQMILSTSNNSNRITDFLGKLTNHHIFQKVVNAREDCLTLNIQRPAGTTAAAKLPVVCWIFGGAFEFGSNSIYDSTDLIKLSISLDQPVLFVAMNYRLGGFGFLGGREVLADGIANLGLLDQRLALEWIADNIAAFGGDPDHVTLWGESSGAISIFDQMALYGGNLSYHGRPLFHGAILDSGSVVPAQPVDGAKAQAIYDAVVAAGHCDGANDTLACLRQLPYKRFLNAANAVPCMASYSSVALSYLPRPDGVVLPESPELIIRDGTYAAVPMIIGDQEDEGTIFSLLQRNITTTDAIAAYLHEYCFSSASRQQLTRLVETYPDDPAAGSPFRTGAANELYPGFKRLSAILGDLAFTLTRRLFLFGFTAAHPDVPAWSYMSSYGYGTPFLGTFHSSDIAQVFYNTPTNYAGHAFQTYYLNFIHNGNPNAGAQGYMVWPAWSEGQQMINFFSNAATLITDDFRQESCRFIMENAVSLRT